MNCVKKFEYNNLSQRKFALFLSYKIESLSVTIEAKRLVHAKKFRDVFQVAASLSCREVCGGCSHAPNGEFVLLLVQGFQTDRH